LEKKGLRDFFLQGNKKNRMNLLLTAFLVGILLLLMGNTFFGTEKEEPKEVDEQETSIGGSVGSEGELEKRMEGILGNIQGAGQVKVMVTYKRQSRSVVAREEKSENSVTNEEGEKGKVKTIENNKMESTVVLTEDGKGRQTPLILTEEVPEIEGVVVVSQGGNNPEVCAALSMAAQAVLDVPAHKVAILKMK